MSIQDVIKNRVSTIKFTTEWVNPEKLIEFLEVAVYAPNHKMRQPWRFIILEGHGKDRFLENYLKLYKDNERNEKKELLTKVFSAPAIISIIMKKNSVLADELEDMQACAALIQNFLLLLEDQKMGSFWKTPKYIESDKFKDALGVQGDELVLGLIMVGYPLVKLEPKKRTSARLLTTIY